MGRGWTRIKVAVMLNGLWIYCFNAGCTMTSLCEQEWQSIFSFLSSCLFSALLRCEWEVLHSNRATNKVKHVYRMCRYTCAQHYGYLQLFYANIYCFYCLSIFEKKNSVSFNFVVGMFCGKLLSVFTRSIGRGNKQCIWPSNSTVIEPNIAKNINLVIIYIVIAVIKISILI